MMAGDFERDKTIRDFGDQWIRHPSNSGRYASLEQFEDIVAPYLTRADVKGRRCADIGSGTGRIVRMLLDAGAQHVTAIEPSHAYAVLVQNTVDVVEKVTCLNARGDEIPPLGFDLILSIGVIHHIPDPKPVLHAAWQALGDQGQLLIWVYSYEGSGLYRFALQPLRLVTRHLSIRINEGIATLLYPITIVYSWLTKLIPLLPLSKYIRDVYIHFDHKTRKLAIVDQINPQWSKYYCRHEIECLVRSAGFSDVRLHHRHGYSWTVAARK